MNNSLYCNNFISKYDTQNLLNKYGSPLFVYSEKIIREQCKEIKKLANINNFNIYYSTKANSSISLLKIIRSEGIYADSMSLGELHLTKQAGYKNDELIYMSNNIRRNELKRILELGINICLDNLYELDFAFSQKNITNSKIYIRINNGVSSGHHENVKTGGKVKFGITPNQINDAFKIANKYSKQINGFCSHIGSQFLQFDDFHENVLQMLELAEKYKNIEYIDFGGGFGISYFKSEDNNFPIEEYSKLLHKTLTNWRKKYNINMKFGIQPGRFLIAESGICITQIQSLKNIYGKKFIGTDLGFNFFPRPMMYNSYHQVIYENKSDMGVEKVDIAGNLCESGDILAKDVLLPKDISVGDWLIFLDAGAYCFSMSSNYTAMTKPAEILIKENGEIFLIRKSESIESLSYNQICI